MAPSPHRPRISVKETATLRKPNDETLPCTIIDVSAEGFRLKLDGAVPCGQGYVLSYGGESHPVEVRWASMGEAGGLFT